MRYGLTTTDPLIPGCSEQSNGNVPAVVNARVTDCADVVGISAGFPVRAAKTTLC